MSLNVDHIKPDKLYSLSEVAGILGIHYQTARSRVRNGLLEFIRVPGGEYQIQGQFLIDYLKKHHHKCDNV